MFDYVDHGDLIEIQDNYWTDITGGELIGTLVKNKEGFYQFHPRKVVLNHRMLRYIAEKISELNCK